MAFLARVQIIGSDADFKQTQKRDYDRRHRTSPLPLIPDSSEVWITSNRDQPVPGTVRGQSDDMPRSYDVSTQSGILRRNRHHLNVIPESDQDGLNANNLLSAISPQRGIVTVVKQELELVLLTIFDFDPSFV